MREPARAVGRYPVASLFVPLHAVGTAGLARRAGECDRQELRRRLTPLPARLGRLLRRGQENPDHKAAGLCRELRKWWPALWTFSRVEGVEPTNNVSERALRPAVVWRKGSFGSDSATGSRFAERLLTKESEKRLQQLWPGLGLLRNRHGTSSQEYRTALETWKAVQTLWWENTILLMDLG